MGSLRHSALGRCCWSSTSWATRIAALLAAALSALSWLPGAETAMVSVYAQAIPTFASSQVAVDLPEERPVIVPMTPGLRYRLTLNIRASAFIGARITGISASCGCLLDGGGDAGVTAGSGTDRMSGDRLSLHALIAAPDEACTLQHSIVVALEFADGSVAQVSRAIVLKAEPRVRVVRAQRLFPRIELAPEGAGADSGDLALRAVVDATTQLDPVSVPSIAFTPAPDARDGAPAWRIAYVGERCFSGRLIFPYRLQEPGEVVAATGYIQVASGAGPAASPAFAVVLARDLAALGVGSEVASFTIPASPIPADPTMPIAVPDGLVACDFAAAEGAPGPSGSRIAVRATPMLQAQCAASSVINLWVFSDQLAQPVCVPLIVK